MLVITKDLNVGQLTFIIRAVLQVLSLGGPFLIGILVLSNAPRLASFATHDEINRVVGHLSVTRSSVSWLWRRIRGNEPFTASSFGLSLSITLLVLYGLFSSLSDVGFLGFYTCLAPGLDKYEHPGSINDYGTAHATMLANALNGTDLASIKSSRCDSSTPILNNRNVSVWYCTSWSNSTWADRDFFKGINSTNSDMLMPRQIGIANTADGTPIPQFFANTGVSKVEVPTISGGILVNPTDIGMQAVFGAPQLSPGYSFTLNRTMALEVEVGCMTVGINTVSRGAFSSNTTEEFQTNGTWRQYSGPDYLYDILSNTTDGIREYAIQLYDPSTLDSNGIMTSVNSSSAGTYDIPAVDKVYLVGHDSLHGGVENQLYLLGNCTNQLRQKFGHPAYNSEDLGDDYMCEYYGVSGTFSSAGIVYRQVTRMVCATTSQVNMVSAAVTKDIQGSSQYNRPVIPAISTNVRADDWEIISNVLGNATARFDNELVERYTLSSGDDGTLSHFILQARMWSLTLSGSGSGGYALSRAANSILQTGMGYGKHKWLGVLGAVRTETLFHPSTLTRWAGLGNLQYNSWVALEQSPILVTSHSSQEAVCYHPVYALGFFPLAFSAIFIIIYTFLILMHNSFRRLQSLGELYGGLYPYWKSICPDLQSSEMTLIWRKEPQAHLAVVPTGNPLSLESKTQRVVDYLSLDSEREQSTSLLKDPDAKERSGNNGVPS
ncbi:hypothetical protein CPB86DRAFT_783707 [Serendipita vermifera]|nr:hypothetical protein CPB86DRAFT_783707 [Serendipita vermifera]